MGEKRCVMILLAAGSGSRMNSGTAKQFMLLEGKPLIWYSLNTVEKSSVIDECILVTAEKDIDYMRCEIVEKYGFHKVSAVAPGGSERWESVANAVQTLEDRKPVKESYVFIHDGARPFLTEEVLERVYQAVKEHPACVAAMPSKDTVRLADESGFAKSTPDRRSVWIIQTPQVFEAGLLIKAYAELRERADRLGGGNIAVTDDAGVVELFTEQRIRLVEGSYDNIKVTTPEDMKIAEAFLEA